VNKRILRRAGLLEESESTSPNHPRHATAAHTHPAEVYMQLKTTWVSSHEFAQPAAPAKCRGDVLVHILELSAHSHCVRILSHATLSILASYNTLPYFEYLEAEHRDH
jgi:hypothetical protein